MLQQEIIVVSPVICILADNNPSASELLNHVGSSGRKYCQMCMIGVNDMILMLPAYHS